MIGKHNKECAHCTLAILIMPESYSVDMTSKISCLNVGGHATVCHWITCCIFSLVLGTADLQKHVGYIKFN